MTLWLIHPDMLPIPHQGKLPICFIFFYVALMPHQGWLPITALATISYRCRLPIWCPNLAGCLPFLPSRTLTPPLMLPLSESLLELYPRQEWLPIWRLRISPHWGCLPLWLIHTALLTLPHRGKLPIWVLFFSDALMPHRGWSPIWIPNTSFDTISHQVWLPI